MKYSIMPLMWAAGLAIMDFKESKTYKNLETAFSGESQARNRYTFYASKARKEGFLDIANKIEQIAQNEKEHAEIWYKLLHGGKVSSTKENLQNAIDGEHYEHTTMYQVFAKEAQEEGYDDIALLFKAVGNIEKDHEAAYTDMLKRVSENKVFQQDQTTCWVCLKCGYVHVGKKAPVTCPVCGHDQSAFALKE